VAGDSNEPVFLDSSSNLLDSGISAIPHAGRNDCHFVYDRGDRGIDHQLCFSSLDGTNPHLAG
jgi:hypothetical protein